MSATSLGSMRTIKIASVPISSRSSPFHWLWVLMHDSGSVSGSFIILAMGLIALFGPELSPYNALKVDPFNRLLPPSFQHWFGTDALGRDTLARMLLGARISLLVGLSTMIASTVLGGLIGLVAGYFKVVDGFIMRVMDGLMAFPSILLAIAIMAVRGPGIGEVILAITVVNVPYISRLVRGQVLATRNLLYVQAAYSIGAQEFRILFRHILPNIISVLIVQASFTFAVAVVVEAGLSFLGAGVPPQIPTWGNILQEGIASMQVAPWNSVVPGLALSLTVLGLNLLGDGLRDSLDPRVQEH